MASSDMINMCVYNVYILYPWVLRIDVYFWAGCVEPTRPLNWRCWASVRRSVGPSVRRSVGPSVRPSVRQHLDGTHFVNTITPPPFDLFNWFVFLTYSPYNVDVHRSKSFAFQPFWTFSGPFETWPFYLQNIINGTHFVNTITPIPFDLFNRFLF